MNEATLTQISDHVYWMQPAKPDRPSLCAVIGTNSTLMLDAGSSDAHARQFLEQLGEEGVPSPASIALTHWHWDHVFGAAQIGAPVIAQQLTADKLVELAKRDWSDAGLEHHITLGEQTAEGAENIKEELPAPRRVRIAQPSIIFQEALELRLGGVTCQIQHVGGDHAADSSVMYLLPDRVLFLGDCLYDAIYAPKRHYTVAKLSRLLDDLSHYDAEYYVEGHNPEVMTRAQFEDMTGKMKLAMTLIEAIGANEAAVFAAVEAQTGQPPDEDAAHFLRALIAGL
ncbi:MAG: MBL fold metallo-hydrolase [Chloroflexota bacterium]